jgi:anti-anti-sigma factor
MPLEIQKSADPQRPGVVTLKLIGSLDTATAPELDTVLIQTLSERCNDLVFDLGQLKFVSSAGLRLFSVARKQLVARGGHASFINMQPQVQEVFQIVESLPGFKLFNDIAALDRYLDSRRSQG